VPETNHKFLLRVEKEKKKTENSAVSAPQSGARGPEEGAGPEGQGAVGVSRESRLHHDDEFALTNWGILEVDEKEGKTFVGENPESGDGAASRRKGGDGGEGPGG